MMDDNTRNRLQDSIDLLNSAVAAQGIRGDDRAMVTAAKAGAAEALSLTVSLLRMVLGQLDSK